MITPYKAEHGCITARVPKDITERKGKSPQKVHTFLTHFSHPRRDRDKDRKGETERESVPLYARLILLVRLAHVTHYQKHCSFACRCSSQCAIALVLDAGENKRDRRELQFSALFLHFLRRARAR